MKIDSVKIQQIPDDSAAMVGLDKKGRSKMPGSMEILQVAEIEHDSGIYLTGLDENGMDLRFISDPVQRKEIADERKALREQLEEYTKKDLKSNSDFWKTFRIEINPYGTQSLNRQNPYDVIKYHALIANGYVAPNRQLASLPRYKFAKYFFLMEDIVADEEVSTIKRRDKARTGLLALEDDKDRLVLIGQYLEGGKYKDSMKPSTLYKNLSDYINDTQNPQKLEEFIKVIKMPVEDVKYKVTVDTAIRKKIIRFKDGYYYFGATNLGRNAVDVLKNLKLPEFSSEYLQIDELINHD
jgi:hypothetical protein